MSLFQLRDLSFTKYFDCRYVQLGSDIPTNPVHFNANSILTKIFPMYMYVFLWQLDYAYFLYVYAFLM